MNKQVRIFRRAEEMEESVMKYNFDEVIDRKGTHAVKVERLPKGADKDSLSLWIADMDFACAEPILKALHERIDRKIFGYTMYDADECMDAVTGWMKKRYGWNESRENLFFCPGIVAAYAALINLLTEPGDGIVLQRPIYYPFTNKANSNGRVPVDNALIYENGAYRIDFEDLDKKMADPSNKVLVVCSPHNPTGRVWEREEIEKAMEIYKANECVVISDEIWSDLTLPGFKHIPTQSVSKDARERTIALYAPSKTFNLAGLVGSYHIIYNRMLRDRVEKASSLSHYNSPNVLSVHALIGAYRPEGYQWVDELREVLKSNADYAYNYILEHFKGVKLSKPEGTYMLYLDCEEWCKEHDTDMDTLLKAGVAVGVIWQDGRPFHRPYAIRLNLALPHVLVKEAFDRMDKYVFNAK